MSARTKRPDASEALGELAGGLAGGARLIVKKSDYQDWVARQYAAGMAAGGRAHDLAGHCGQRPHARAHLQKVRAFLVLPAAGAGCLRNCDRRHDVHHDAAAHGQLLERREVTKIRLPAPRHVAHAHRQRWARPEPWDGPCGTGRASQRVPHSVESAVGEKDGHVGELGGATAGRGRAHKKSAQHRHGGRVSCQWAARRSQHELERSSRVVSRVIPT